MSFVPARILIVDDDAGIREALAERLAARGRQVTCAQDGRSALEKLREGVDVVLLDLQLPRGDGLWVLERARAEELDTTAIVISAHGTIDRAVAAMKLGAYDFLQKPFDAARLDDALARAEERAALRRIARAARREADDASSAQGRGPAIASPAMLELEAQAQRAAASDATILLCGESGSGKEVLARRIHAASARANGPFVALNCAAVADGLLESELFGHEKGAFSGAATRRAGCFEAAHGGTLLLDEIGDTSPGLQVRLLRAMAERRFARVGSSQEISVHLRVIAATHRDLRAEVAAGRFREDLFFRLNVIPLRVPALRERREDIPALVEHFLTRAPRTAERAPRTIDATALRRLTDYDWPGNVRELENAILRAAVLASEAQIGVDDLPEEIASGTADGTAQHDAFGFHGRVEEFRARLLHEALARAGGNQTQAAKDLGLQRSYLARLLRKYGRK